MNGKTAARILLVVSVVLAVLLMTKVITPELCGGAFAVALVGLGLPSRGFTRRTR